MERLDRHQLPKGWVELPVTGVFTVDDGLITSWHDSFDDATIERGFTDNNLSPERRRRPLSQNPRRGWLTPDPSDVG
jgi:hypothetical protein